MNPQQEMVDRIRDFYGLSDQKVLSAMKTVSRHKFVPEEYQFCAYEDRAIAIGYGQTISQPYTVSFMTHILKLKGNEKVLEVGTGSGYQAAVLSGLCKDVYTSEVVGVLAESAKARLKKLDYSNVYVRFGNGEDVWRDKAPFDSIIITAGLKKIPGIFFDQLKVGGNLVAPVGSKTRQEMTKYTKDNKGEITKKDYGTYVFVSYVGKAKSK